MAGVVTLERAIASLDPTVEERALIEKAWGLGGRPRLQVEALVRSRCLRLLVEGPPGSGKTKAARGVADALVGGLDVIDVDQDTSVAGSDRWRSWPVDRPPVVFSPGQAGASALRAASQRSHDQIWASLVQQTSAVAAELRSGHSSGVVLDTATSLISALMDAAAAGSVDLGDDDNDSDRMAADRYRGSLYKAASIVSGQVWGLATEGVWTAPAGPVVGICLAHAKPVTDPVKREFRGWSLALGPIASNEIRGRADFVVACGMDPSDKPGAARLRWYARVDESAAGGAKARWSETSEGVADAKERDPALKALATLDLASFVRHVVTYRRGLHLDRLRRLVG